MKKIRICSLFAGAGGIDYAFQLAGSETVWANENDKAACATFRLNFPDVPLDERDIRVVPACSIPDFDILTAGFPCQPFSIVGKERGFEDQRGNLFFEITRIIDEKNPRAIFLENVANLEKHDSGKTFSIIRQELVSRGYSFRYLVADAQEYGFPQHRNRIYIVCFRNKLDAENFIFPEKKPLQIKVFDIINKRVKAPEQYYLSPESEQFRRMDVAIVDDNQVYRFSDGRYSTPNGILAGRDGISFTLLAGMGNWHDREPIIRDCFGIRKLSPYECFMLQGFPKSFSLQGIRPKDAYRQAGNTVCVPVVKQFATQIIHVLKSIPAVVSDNDTLVGVLSSTKQLEVSLRQNFYHFPARFLPLNMDMIKFIAIYQSERLFPGHSGIQYIGKIASYKLIPRYSIKEIPKQSSGQYCRIEISEWIKLKEPAPFVLKGNICVTKQFWLN